MSEGQRSLRGDEKYLHYRMVARRAFLEAVRIAHARKKNDFSAYEKDPVGFGEHVLGYKYTADIQRVMNSVVRNPVTIARSSTGVGKTHGAASIAVWFYLVYPDSKVFLTAAPPLTNLTRLLWGEVGKIVEKNRDIFSGHIVRSLYIERNKSSYMQCITIPQSGTSEEREAKWHGKHAPHLLFVLDEGDAIPEEVYRAIDGAMSGGHARLLVLFNPKAKRGPVYEKERKKQAKVYTISSLVHPNVKTGRDVIPGAVTRESVLRRINEWTVPITNDEINEDDPSLFKVPAYLVGTTAKAPDGNVYPPLSAGWRRITEPSFSYMVLGRYPPRESNQLIAEAWVDAAIERWKQFTKTHDAREWMKNSRPIAGLDCAELGGDLNVEMFRYGDFVDMPVIWEGIDIAMSIERAYTITTNRNTEVVMVDGSGIGAGVAPGIVRMARQGGVELRAVSVKVSNKPTGDLKTDIGDFYQLRDQLWWAVREWLRTNPNAMLPPDRMLREELLMPTYSKTEKGLIKILPKDAMRQELHRSPDRADALCLTFAPYSRPKVISINIERR